MSTVIYELSDHVATLTLNRPQALNALNSVMVDDLRQATAKAAFDPQVRAVVLCAAGDHFMAGGDLKWFRDQLTVPPAERQLRFEAMIASVHAAILNLKGMGKPAIAAVHGAVAGFGMSLMMACDLVVAADNAYFTLAYATSHCPPMGVPRGRCRGRWVSSRRWRLRSSVSASLRRGLSSSVWSIACCRWRSCRPRRRRWRSVWPAGRPPRLPAPRPCSTSRWGFRWRRSYSPSSARLPLAVPTLTLPRGWRPFSNAGRPATLEPSGASSIYAC